MCTPAKGLLQFLQQIPDPRGRKGRRHSLQAMLASVVCSVLCGARSFAAIEQWIHLQESEFWHALGFTRRPPTQNAWRNLLDLLDADMFEAVLARWVDAVWDGREDSAASDTIPTDTIDGKVLCGAIGEHGRALCLLTRVDQATGRVLSQTPVESKTNEHKAALAMLQELVLNGELTGRLIVGDAFQSNSGRFVSGTSRARSTKRAATICSTSKTTSQR